MSKKKPEPVPDHVSAWNTIENQFAAAKEFGKQVTEDAAADIAIGRPIEDARLIAAGLAVSSGGSKGAAASKETRQGPQSKRAAIIAAGMKHPNPTSAQVAAIARTTGSTARWVREVLGLKKTEG